MNKGEFLSLSKATESKLQKAIRRVAEATHRLNDAIVRAVQAGVSVELVRVSRFHDEAGNWGDQMIPLVREARIERGFIRSEDERPEPEEAENSEATVDRVRVNGGG